MEEREYTVDELSSPYEEDMSNEISPAVQYYAGGGSVDERGLFSQQIPQRPQMQQRPQPQQLKRTAAEMLQRMPQVAMGTMRFSPLTMPGVSGRPVQQFAEGGEVEGMTAEERQRINVQTGMGAPVDNLFGASLGVPAAAPLPSFETDIPEFNPTYTPPTGPTGAAGLALGDFPTGLGTKPTFTFAGTQQATVPATAKSLYEQIVPSTLAAAPYDFSTVTGTTTGKDYAPTEQTFTKPTLLSEEQARLKQPVLTRYEPDIKFGGLTTYLGPLQTSPYKDTGAASGGTTSGGTTSGGTTTEIPQWKTYGFTESATGTAEPTFWYNRNLGVSFTSPTGALVPPSPDWMGTPVSDVFKTTEDTVTGGAGNDTVTGGTFDWVAAAKTSPDTFRSGNFTRDDDPQERKVKTLEDVFARYGGTGVLPAFKAEGEGPVEMLATMVTAFKDPKFGWDKKTQSFNLTPTAVLNILQSKTFKTTATGTVNNMLNEAGYIIGGKKSEGIYITPADRDALVKRLTSGNTNITRIANEITQPLRSTNRLSVTQADTPTLFNVYTNAGVIKPPTAAGGGGGTGDTTAPKVKAGSFLGISDTVKELGLFPGTKASAPAAGTFTVGGKTFQGRPEGATGPSYPKIPTSLGGYNKKRAEGSPPEGEYADPVEAIRERQRMRREMGTMDQGSARDRLKKFSGGEDLTPVQEFSKGGPAVKGGNTPISYQEAVAFRDSEVGSQIPRIERLLRPSNWNNLNSGLKKQYLNEIQGAMNDPVNYSLNQLKKDAAGYTVYQGLPGGGGTAKAEARDLKSNIDRYTNFLQSSNQPPEMIASTANQGFVQGQKQLQNSVRRMNDEPLLNRISDVGLQVGLGAATAGLSLPGQIAANAALQLGQGTKPMDALKNVARTGGSYFGRGLLSNAMSPGSLVAGSTPSFAPVQTFVPGTSIPVNTALNLGRTAYNVATSKDPAVDLAKAAFKFGARNLGPSNQVQYPIPFAHGGAVHRAEGSPVQGEKVDRANQPITTPDGYEISPSFGDRMGANVSDFLINAGTKAASLFPADETKLSAAHRLFLDTFGVKENRAPVTKAYFNQEELDALTDLISRKGGKKGSIAYKDYETLMGDRPLKKYPLTSGRLDPYVSISKSLGQFNYEYDPKTGNYKILDEYDFNPKVLKSGVSSDSNFIGDYIGENYSLFDKLRLYAGRKLPPGTGRQVDLSVPAKKAVKRAEGSPVYGEMADTGGVTPETIAALRNRQGLSATEALNVLKKVYGEGVSNAESVLRGSAAAIPGAFGDIESLFRDSDKTRKLATTEEVLRDYMPKRVTKPTKETKGFEETGTYMPLPIPTSAVKKAGAVAKTGARKALEELGPTAAGMAERQLQKSGLGPMYAVKPGGGTFFPPEYGAQLDDYLDRVVKDLSSSETLAGKDAKTVADFIRTKGRNYLTTTYGTSNDPLRAALSEGRLPRYGSDKERFRKYLLKAAEEGDPEALEDLERFYDTASGVDAIAYVPTNKQARDFEVSLGAQDAMRKRMAAEGVEPEFMNPTFPSSRTKEQLEANYSTQSRKNLAELMRLVEDAPTVEEKQRKLTALGGDLKSLSYAAEKGEPIYDVSSPYLDFMQTKSLAQGIASIPVADLERMSFPEAVIKGSQNMRLKRDWEAVIKNAESGKTVPKDIFFTGTEPVYELDKSKQWVRIMTPDAVQLEGAAMRHSIGGYKTSDSYNLGGKDAFNSGLARVFSLRNEKGVPQVTIETKFTDEGGLEITRGGVRSKFNSEPTAAEKSAVFQLFDTLGPKVINPTKYTVSRAGDSLDEATTIDWGQEYADYLKYKNKGEGINNANR